MSNVGTTATISPAEANPTLPVIETIGETEMDNALSLFERMANSVVSASKLMPVVQGLMKDVDSLKKDIEHVREQNSRLDEILTRTRAERNEAEAKVNALNAELNGAKQTNESLHRELEDSRNNATSLIDTLQTVRKDRDDWMEAALKADADLQAANAKLAKFQETYAAVFGNLLNMAQPTAAQPDPVQLPSWAEVKDSTNLDAPTHDKVIPSADPQPALQAEPDNADKAAAYVAPQEVSMPKAEPEAKPETNTSTERYPELKPWENY